MAPLFTFPPTCISWSPTGRYSTLASSLRETCCCATSNLPLGVTHEGREAIKTISGAVVGDSSLQDRGVAHYILSLIFSLFSLPFSFYFCVPYQKYQKYLLPCLLMLSLRWVLNHPNIVGWTCFTWLVFDQFVLALKTQPTWLRENHCMTMLITCGTAYLRKGNTYGIKYKFHIAMLNLYATFMILLASLI